MSRNNNTKKENYKGHFSLHKKKIKFYIYFFKQCDI